MARVRCFGPEQRLSLVDGSRAAKWTVILGENGVGKTTLLQCLWAMAPSVDEPQPGTLVGASPRGALTKRFDALRRDLTSNASVLAEVLLDEPLTSEKVGRPGSGLIRTTSPAGKHFQGYAGLPNAVCCGYGALRRSAEAGVEAGSSSDSAASLFSDEAALISGSEWLLRADYAARTTSDDRAAMRRDKIRAALIGDARGASAQPSAPGGAPA